MATRRRTKLKKSLLAIERAFADIERLFAGLTRRVRVAERHAGRAAKSQADRHRPRRRLRISPKRRAQLKLQGAYMGFMRQLKPAQKALVRTLKEKKGFEAAIKIAKKIATT